MAKSHADAPSASGHSDRPMIEALQPEAIVESCSRILRHMDEINRAWLAALKQANDSGWDLAGSLARCSDPMDAQRLCTDWMADRRDAMLADGQRLSGMWIRLCEQELAAVPGRPRMGEGPAPMSRMAAAE